MTDKEKILAFLEGMSKGCCPKETKEIIINIIIPWINDLPQEPISEEFEKALAEEWQGYVDRGAATVDALENNTQELAFAKGFYRGAQWQKEQMVKDAIEGRLFEIYDKCSFKYRLDVNCDIPTDKYKDGNKVKVIIIKEE